VIRKNLVAFVTPRFYSPEDVQSIDDPLQDIAMTGNESQRTGSRGEELADLLVSLARLGLRITISFGLPSLLFFYVGQFSVRQSVALGFVITIVVSALRNSEKAANPRRYRVTFQPVWRDVLTKHGLIESSDRAWQEFLNQGASCPGKGSLDDPRWKTATFTVLAPDLVYQDGYGCFARCIEFGSPIYAGERNEASGTPYWYGKWQANGFSIGIVTNESLRLKKHDFDDAGKIELAVVPKRLFRRISTSDLFAVTQEKRLNAAMSKAGWEPGAFGYDWQHPMMSLRCDELW